MKKYKRIFLIVMDSLGIGDDPKAKEYNDEGANTFLHILEANNGLNIPKNKITTPTKNWKTLIKSPNI